MTFHAASYLRKATGRAKSDVANKLVSMFLHEVSRKICASLDLNVSDPRYANAVDAKFGDNCGYCGKPLENDRVAIEHLNGMNRFRAGLHIPGNVIIACKKCNNEKRRDDQLHELTLAKNGWESFLSHNSTLCEDSCKTCAYWRSVWPDKKKRILNLKKARQNILNFQSEYPSSIEWGRNAQNILCLELDGIYRECQTFATSRILRAVDQVFSKLAINPSGTP